MSRALGITLAIVIALAAIGYGGRVYANRTMAAKAMAPKTLGPVTPANAGLPFSRVAVEAGDRTLIGWWVRARADSGKTPPAILFLHGNRSSISDYVNLQKFFYRQGISSLVFDYSGFGASGGTASLRNAVVDAGTAAKVFADSAGPDARKIAMGTALGATVLLQAIDSVQPHVNGLVIEGVAASVKEAAVREGRVPKLIAPLVEDVGDNVTAARRVTVPLLAVHSYADDRFPIADAQRVVAAIPGQYSLVRHWRKGHSSLLASTKPCDWQPILQFVKLGALPAARLDTTNQCEVEARLVAARDSAQKAAVQSTALPRVGTTPTGAPKTVLPPAPTKPVTTKAAATTTPGAKTTTTTKAGAKTPTSTSTKTKTATKRPPSSTTKKP